MTRKKKSGIILMSAMVVAFIMTLWVIAELSRNSSTTSAVLFDYRKTEAQYLAKRAISRSLNKINLNGAWLTAHNSKSSGDTATTDGATCWAETTAAGLVLRSEAKVGTQTKILSVPLKKLDDHDTHLYSITPAAGGGPDLIAWKTASGPSWDTLPPIPGMLTVTAVTGSATGDVYSIACGADGQSKLWRYRSGRSWLPMLDPPEAVKMMSLTMGGSSRLIGLGKNLLGEHTLQALDLSAPLEWKSIAPPAGGYQIAQVAIPMNSADDAYAATLQNGSLSVHRYKFDSAHWDSAPVASAPVAATFQADGITFTQTGSLVTNFDAGIGVDSDGNLYGGSNSTNGDPSVIYRFDKVSHTWQVLPPTRAFQYDDQGNLQTGSPVATNLKDLTVDDDGNVWVQWQSPVDESFSTQFIDTSAL